MRRSLIALTVCAVGASMITATTATAADVTVPITTTVATGGLLTMAGTGIAVTVAAQPGQTTSSLGSTVLAVSDLRGTAQGWQVTASYSDPAAAALTTAGAAALGGANVLVSATNATGTLSGTNLSLATDQALTGPVAVASTGSAGGSGLTDVTTAFKVKVPVTAQTTDIFLGTVTYTLSTIR